MIKNSYRLSANVVVAASTVLVPATVGGLGLSFACAAGQKLHIRASGAFTIGATGGFKFELLSPAATNYLAAFGIIDTVTPNNVASVLTALGSFANALAVAGTHILNLDAEIIPSVAGTIVLQLACNSAANSITLLEGAFFDVTLL